MNVFAYLRVSGKGQIDGDGFERQEEKIKAFCAAHSLDLVDVIREEGVSGTVDGMSRPAFAAMVMRANSINATNFSPRLDAIVVERVDRLARDLMVSEMLLAECRKCGIKVFAADQGVILDVATNDTDPTRILIRQLTAAIAQWEKNTTVLKMRAARERIRAKGERCEGRKPFGSTPDEAVTVRMIVAWRTSVPNSDGESFSFQEIAHLLNETGRTQRNGRPWNWRAVRRMVERLTKRGLIK